MSEAGRAASNAIVAVVDFYARERAGLEAKNEEQAEHLARLAEQLKNTAATSDQHRRRADAEQARAEREEQCIFELTEKVREGDPVRLKQLERENEDAKQRLRSALRSVGESKSAQEQVSLSALVTAVATVMQRSKR